MEPKELNLVSPADYAPAAFLAVRSIEGYAWAWRKAPVLTTLVTAVAVFFAGRSYERDPEPWRQMGAQFLALRSS